MIEAMATAMASARGCALELERVTIALGGRTILADTDLTVGAGEFVGVLGPNGAGKSTLLRAIGNMPSAYGCNEPVGSCIA